MIPLYCLSATDNRVATLDDPAVDGDFGGAITAPVRIVSAPFEAGAWSGFRRFVQTVILGGTVTLGVTPITDGSSGPMQTVALSAGTQGAQVAQLVALAAHGTRHQVQLDIVARSGAVELGEWQRRLVPRRTERGG